VVVYPEVMAATAKFYGSLVNASGIETTLDVPGVGHDGERMSIAAAPLIAAALHATPCAAAP